MQYSYHVQKASLIWNKSLHPPEFKFEHENASIMGKTIRAVVAADVITMMLHIHKYIHIYVCATRINIMIYFIAVFPMLIEI